MYAGSGGGGAGRPLHGNFHRGGIGTVSDIESGSTYQFRILDDYRSEVACRAFIVEPREAELHHRHGVLHLEVGRNACPVQCAVRGITDVGRVVLGEVVHRAGIFAGSKRNGGLVGVGAFVREVSTYIYIVCHQVNSVGSRGGLPALGGGVRILFIILRFGIACALRAEHADAACGKRVGGTGDRLHPGGLQPGRGDVQRGDADCRTRAGQLVLRAGGKQHSCTYTIDASGCYSSHAGFQYKLFHYYCSLACFFNLMAFPSRNGLKNRTLYWRSRCSRRHCKSISHARYCHRSCHCSSSSRTYQRSR